jgi:hypothetical protein
MDPDIVLRTKDICLEKDQKMVMVPVHLLMQQNDRLQECQNA